MVINTYPWPCPVCLLKGWFPHKISVQTASLKVPTDCVKLTTSFSAFTLCKVQHLVNTQLWLHYIRPSLVYCLFLIPIHSKNKGVRLDFWLFITPVSQGQVCMYKIKWHILQIHFTITPKADAKFANDCDVELINPGLQNWYGQRWETMIVLMVV